MIFGEWKLRVVKVMMEESRLLRQFSDLFMSIWVVLFTAAHRCCPNGMWFVNLVNF